LTRIHKRPGVKKSDRFNMVMGLLCCVKKCKCEQSCDSPLCHQWASNLRAVWYIFYIFVRFWRLTSLICGSFRVCVYADNNLQWTVSYQIWFFVRYAGLVRVCGFPLLFLFLFLFPPAPPGERVVKNYTLTVHSFFYSGVCAFWRVPFRQCASLSSLSLSAVA
jgi:hypothetical protein